MKLARILIFADHFQPGFKAGGPIQSLTNLSLMLRERYEVYLVSKNHDLKEESIPYPGIQAGEWEYSDKFGINLFYQDPAMTGLNDFRELIAGVAPNFIYLNSLFSVKATIMPLLAIARYKLPGRVILAPRGELAPGALAIKPLKKRLYLAFFRLFLKDKVYKWHATSDDEENDIHEKYAGATIHKASNLPFMAKVPKRADRGEKATADFILISRIARIKNIDFAIDAFAKMEQPFSADIFGVVEDQVYWGEIQQKIAGLKEGATVRYRGEIKPAAVIPTLQQYRFYLSPTKGENFGHSIFEAMLAGLPIVISDRTPWRALAEKNIGWDMPLDEISVWQHRLDACIRMGVEEYRGKSSAVNDFAEVYREKVKNQDGYKALFS